LTGNGVRHIFFEETTMRLLITIGLVFIFATFAFAQRGNLSRAEIKGAEQHLSDAGFWTGPIDGVFDAGSRSALIAFQKWHGRDVTGQLTIDELDVILTSSRPGARELGYEHVEVDLDRQVLMLVDHNGSVRVLPTSTGNGKTFTDDGQESVSYTPRGRFLVYDKSVGWETGPLGLVYYPNYISGGVAIHGARSVPNQPASHGCIRIPVFAAREVSKLLKVGTIVLVYDKVSFVSAKDWVANPQRKEAALLSLTAEVDEGIPDVTGNKSRPAGKRRARSRIVRT
jgi:hypothetical protein